jgi:WD40 repeat protein/tetratricopeptide (TPR) repeat protein
MNNTIHHLPNPFPGLRPFQSDEHHLFFGREQQTAALLQLLRTNRFLAVVGTSGSGKSSLVRAGMIAELHGGTMTQAGSNWEVMILRPGGSPIENLARAFVETGLYDPEDPGTLPRLLATLNRSRFGLVEAMKQSQLGGMPTHGVGMPQTNLLVVVDQFEELFRFRQQGVDSEETASAFVNLLLTASEQEECPIYVTITMRSDYLGDCSEIPGLAEAVNNGEYLIPRLLRDQKRDAIEKPIGVGGAKISPLLVQRLLNEVGDDPDQLPVLQHALMRMWHAWSKRSENNRPIDIGDFEATGGMASALSNHADEIYESLPDDRHRHACAKIFKTLTVRGDDNRGIRRPTRLAVLEAIAEADRDTVTTVLDAFRSPGVTFLMPTMEVKLSDRTVLDLSHESLMRCWERLRGWVEEEAQSARIFRRLLDTSRLWGDGKAGLFRDPDLQIALTWRAQEKPNEMWAEQYGGHFETAISFLEASHAEALAERQGKEAAQKRELEQAQELAESRKQRLIQQQRATRRLRKLMAGLAVLTIIAAGAGILALISRNEASRLALVAAQEADNARQNEEKARQSQQATASALVIVESQKKEVDGSLSKAEAAERLARAAEETGRKLLYTTDMRLAPFVWRDDRSTASQLRVLLAKHIPEESDKEGLGAINNTRPESGSSPVPHSSSIRKPDLRGFEWYYYQHLLEHGSSVFLGHPVPVVDGAFATDGQLVTLDDHGQVRRWDPDSQLEDEANRRDLPGGLGAKERVLSPDGRLAALAEGKKVHVFDAVTGMEKYSFDSVLTYTGFHRRLIFSRDSAKLIIVDNNIRWFNAESGKLIATVAERFDRVEDLACTADGRTLAIVGHGNTGGEFAIFRLDATSGTVAPLARAASGVGSLQAGALSPDGQRLAVGAKLGGTVAVFDTATGLRTATHGSAHPTFISAMAYSSDGAVLATADAEGTIKVWGDVQKLNPKSTPLRMLKGHEGVIQAIGFSIDGKRLVSVSADKTARVWDLETADAAIRPLEGVSQNTYVARFSPDGRLIAASGTGSVRLWDASSGRLVRLLPSGDKSVVHSVAFSPTDRRLLAVGYGGQVGVSHVSLWDIDAGTELARFPGATDLPGFQVDQNNGPVGALAFSPDGKYLVAGFGFRNFISGQSFPVPLKVWEVATRRLTQVLYGHTGYCMSLVFSMDGTLLASGSQDGTALIWSTATWKPVHSLRNSVAAEPQATLFLRRGFSNVAFSPDGKTLALASREGSVQLWDAAAGKLLTVLKGHSSAATAIVFSPDGRTLVSGGMDQTVRLWNVETRRELMQLDRGSIQLGNLFTLAFSADGKQLLVGGGRAAVWSAAPDNWNDPVRAAEELQHLLQSKADFQNRICMLSENLRLHEALAKLDAKGVRVQAALAATRANWHASQYRWDEAAKEVDRLIAADPADPSAWLRTPGLLRLATALLHQDRPHDAAALLTGGVKRRALDGLPPAVNRMATGIIPSVVDGAIQITELLPGSPAARSDLRQGDVIVKVNETEVTAESLNAFAKLLDAKLGPNGRLTVRHPGSERPVEIELSGERFVSDTATGKLLHPLLAAIRERLDHEPRDPGLLELRAELAGQWSDANAQVADYTAAIDVLSQQNVAAAAADLKRLFGRRGNAYVALRQWQRAVDDYARTVSNATTDPVLLSNRARAYESLKNWDAAAADWSRAAAGNPEGAKLLAEFARRLAASAQMPLANNEFEKSQALYESMIQANPEKNLVAAELAQVLLDKHGKETTKEDQKKRLAFLKIADPWAKLAVAYHVIDDQQALETLVKSHPEAASGVGDFYAGVQDWKQAIAEYSKHVTDQPADVALFTKLAIAYESARRTPEAVPYLAKMSAANLEDTMLSLKVAALEAWFGQEKEYSATRQRILGLAKDTNKWNTADRAAKASSIRPSTDKAELEAALALGRTAVELEKNHYTLLALGMAEYRSGYDEAAVEALLAAEKSGANITIVMGIAPFYRAMSLFRLGRAEEARKVATLAAAKMQPLPKDEQNPLVNVANSDFLIVWMAYREARALLNFDPSPIETQGEARNDEVKSPEPNHPTGRSSR